MDADSILKDMLDFAVQIETEWHERRRQLFVELRGQEPPKSGFPDISIPARVPSWTRAGVGMPIADASYWLDVCSRLSGPASDFDHETRRGYTIACKLMGIGWNAVQNAIGSARTSGPAAAGAAWAYAFGVPDQRYIGSLYVAHKATDPGILKVGFTTDIEKRLRRLSSEAGEAVILLGIRPATMMHEWALHMMMRHPVAPEWYPTAEVPSWIIREVNTAHKSKTEA